MDRYICHNHQPLSRWWSASYQCKQLNTVKHFIKTECYFWREKAKICKICKEFLEQFWYRVVYLARLVTRVLRSKTKSVKKNSRKFRSMSIWSFRYRSTPFSFKSAAEGGENFCVKGLVKVVKSTPLRKSENRRKRKRIYSETTRYLGEIENDLNLTKFQDSTGRQIFPPSNVIRTGLNYLLLIFEFFVLCLSPRSITCFNY